MEERRKQIKRRANPTQKVKVGAMMAYAMGQVYAMIAVLPLIVVGGTVVREGIKVWRELKRKE